MILYHPGNAKVPAMPINNILHKSKKQNKKQPMSVPKNEPVLILAPLSQPLGIQS